MIRKLNGRRLPAGCAFLLLLLSAAAQPLHAQERPPDMFRAADPCGYPDTTSLAYKLLAAVNWGYGYTDLLNDLASWGASPYVSVESVGKSVQGRDLYLLTVTGSGAPSGKKRIWIHARTHPSEVEGSYVTNEIIRFLLSGDSLAARLRDSCIFNILPMENPDGVELQKPRENANGIDIESNWNTFPHQPEVDAIESQYMRFMQSPAPIRIALNMHSAYDCKRYFVYHAPGGTSEKYAADERRFIAMAQVRYPGGFQNFDYFVSWTSSTPLQYPESWMWTHFHEGVLAMTYEDMNCTAHGSYDLTASAIVGAISDYLFWKSSSPPDTTRENPPEAYTFTLEQNFPNPAVDRTAIRFSIDRPAHVSILLYDLYGRKAATVKEADLKEGYYQELLRTGGLPSGIYFYRLEAGGRSLTRSMIVSK